VAQDLLGQGGIPNVVITSGGEIIAIRLEHVWVEAFVDFEPSRGANHIKGDSWTPIDASFKRYELTGGTALFEEVPFNYSDLIDQLMQAADIDDQVASITGIDLDIIMSTIHAYDQNVRSFFEANSISDVIPEEVFSQLNIVSLSSSELSAGLPCQVLARSNSTAVLPDNLRHSAQINLYASELDKMFGSPSVSYHLPLPELNYRRLGIAYIPSNAQDAQLLQSYSQKGATSIQPYLLRANPTIQVDGVSVATGVEVRMGVPQFIEVILKDTKGANRVTFDATSGDEIVLGINGNGITQEIVEARFNAVENNSAAENLHQIALHYWMDPIVA
jgi:hypothetical protein